MQNLNQKIENLQTTVEAVQTTMNLKDLRKLSSELDIHGRTNMNKPELVVAVLEKLNSDLKSLKSELAEIEEQARLAAEQAAAEQTVDQEEVKPSTTSRNSTKGKIQSIEVYKDGELFTVIEGLLNTFKWAVDNEVCNAGWVKRSLKTKEETKPGRKYKQGGYLFKYAE